MGKLTLPDGTTYEDSGQTAAKATWDGETISVGPVAKSDDERRYTLNLIYPADKADIGKALDGHRDFASKAVVEEAAWNFMRKYRQVGVAHTPEHAKSLGVEFQASGAAEPVESYIWPGPDWTPPGTDVVIKAGDWLGGFVWSPEAWAEIKAGKIGGVSVEGGATRRKPSPEAVAALRS